MLHPVEPPAFHPPLIVTCGTKQIQTCLEPTTFDPQGRTLISIHLMLAAEQVRRPTLTLAKLWVELSVLYNRMELPRPKQWHVPGESETLTTYSPVPVCATMDSVDVKFEACVVVDVFPPGLCLGPQELKCYNINHQEPTGEARIDERASLVVSFVVPHAAPIPLRGLVDTGSGVSILTFSAFNRVAARTGAFLKPYQIDLYAANEKTIKTFGLAEQIRFQLGGYELETNFVVVDDAMGVEDFLLGRNFLRSYQVLVDLTSMKIVVRAPVKPVWHHAHTQVGDDSLTTPITLDSDLVLQPFERTVAKAKLVTNALEPLIFQTVALNASLSDPSLQNTIFLEDSVATVSETGTLYVSLVNLTSNQQRVRCGAHLGTVVPVSLVYQAVPQKLDATVEADHKTEADNSRANFVYKVYSEMNLSTASELTSSSEFEFLSATDPSEAGLSEREIRKRTDPDLLAPIPGPDSQLQEVKKLWGASACESLDNILNEFDDLFMKRKADLGRCTIAKHTIEVEPEAVPPCEGARRMSPEKAERANQEVRSLLALGMIQPSLSPWASGIVMVKKKSGELRFCCDFRPLNEVTIKDAYPLLRIDESLARLGNAKIYTSINLAWPDLPPHLQNLEPKAPDQALRVLRRVQRANKRERQAKALAAPLPPQPPPVLQKHEDFYPDYPEDWIDVTTEASEDYLLPTHAVNVPSRTIYSVTGTSNVRLQNSPGGVRESIMALKDIDTELHEHTHTVHGIKDLVLAQNRDVHVLALKKLVQCESLDNDVLPENVREFARNYFRQKKDLLFINKNDVPCVQNSPTPRPLHERPCMIIMPQLYQHEILFRAHDAMGHQGISKVVARIQERHTWPGIRRSVGRYVGQCLTCQQVRDKPGDVRFQLKNIQSGYFNELVQYDHLKICPSDNNNTGILVIIDHFSKFAEAVPCSHHDYDAVTTSRLLQQKWFARHGTPTRMQSDNAPNLTAEVSNEFLKAAHVTKVTSTAGHPRTQGLVERQNRTLLTLLRVFCSRRMRDWDQCLDEVIGAYNSTRHATTGFSPYMLTRGVEKAIPLTFLYPEFAAKSFDTHEAYVDHVLARQQEIHDLVRRNTHQAQLRQKLKYDRAIRARAYQPGELVWVFCLYVLQKGSPKLMRAWRGPHKIVQDFQEGRVYVLDTGQKVHFERLKPHHSGPLELATAQAESGEIVVLMDPDPERSVEAVDDDKSQPSYKTEQLLSEASDVSLPSRKQHWMDTRLRTKLRAGGSRMHYQQFDYSTSGTDDELSEIMLPVPPDPVDADRREPEPQLPSDQSTSPTHHLPQLFSDHERARSPSPRISSPEKQPSLLGTSAPLLTNPSLTSFLNNYPIWPAAPSLPLKCATEDDDAQSNVPTLPTTLPGAGTAPSFKRGRGRPPKTRKKLVRAKARLRKKETTTIMPSETVIPTETSEGPRYQLRSRRQPRYKCGTCGLRDCVCLLAVNENRRVPTGARGVPPERGENLVHRLTVRAEKTYSSLERHGDHPVDTILEKLSLPGVAKAPCPRFKEWTSDGKGLEFTLATVMPPVPSNIAFGPFNFEREPVQMVRCITANLLCDKYGIHVDPGGVYSPAPHWWLLVTAPRVEAIVEPLHLLSCLEGLMTLTTADLILCFHIIDWYRGKVKFAWWLELIITCFLNYPRIRLLDEWTHTFEIPLPPKAVLSTLDTWVRAGSDNRAMPRSVWQDVAAIQGRTPRVCLPADNGPGRDYLPGNPASSPNRAPLIRCG